MQIELVDDDEDDWSVETIRAEKEMVGHLRQQRWTSVYIPRLPYYRHHHALTSARPSVATTSTTVAMASPVTPAMSTSVVVIDQPESGDALAVAASEAEAFLRAIFAESAAADKSAVRGADSNLTPLNAARGRFIHA